MDTEINFKTIGRNNQHRVTLFKHFQRPFNIEQPQDEATFADQLLSEVYSEAKQYLSNRAIWPELTRFLSVSGAHLDNNLVERALKLAIRTRKNAMFHKSLHGAYVAGLLLSLIATCEPANENPVKYLIALQEHKSDVFKHPDLWLPWNYESTRLGLQNAA